jgi:SAM-dependent methyltransferase
MSQAPIPERAISFGGIAESYDRYRPAPPAEAADWMLPTHPDRVVDVCAGTGSFSRLLAGRARQVISVDLDTRMLAVLRSRSPGIGAVCATGDVLPLLSGAVDAVLVSSGWHWLDPSRAVPEIARVTRPGGVLGAVWSGPDRRVPWVEDLLGGSHRGGSDRTRHRRELSIPSGQPFGPPERQVIEWSLPRAPSELVGLAGTYSVVITSGSEEREAVRRRAVELTETHPALEGRSSIELPMRTLCWRAVRLAMPHPRWE